ncbi:MAG: hypothetical protein ACSHX8_12375 [Opitutaceae bacterium]
MNIKRVSLLASAFALIGAAAFYLKWSEADHHVAETPEVTKEVHDVTHAADCSHCVEQSAVTAQAIDMPVEGVEGTRITPIDQMFDAFNAAASNDIAWQDVADLTDGTYVGEPVVLNLPGIELSGTVDMQHTVQTIHKYGVTLDDDLGRAFFTIHDNGKINGHVFFNGESRAFKLRGTEHNWTVEASSVSGILCAPVDAIYPLSGDASFLASVSATRDSFVTADGLFVQAGFDSLPSSEYVIYIDFDGELVSDTGWNNILTGPLIVATPHPQANNDSWVEAIWKRVSEDFAPFDVNVTTDRDVYEAADVEKRVMCIVTTNDIVSPGDGGVAYLDSFGGGEPCWTFNTQEYACADTVSHEVGHTLGLLHDGTYVVDDEGDETVEDYFEGYGAGAEIAWGPIMGAPFIGDNVNVTQWSIGEYQDAGNGSGPNTQDDLNVIVTQNGFGYRADDHADDTVSATSLNVSGSVVDDLGIVETTGDIDYFAFTSIGGYFEASADPLNVESNEGEDGSETFGANLAVELVLYDSAGTIMDTDAPGDRLGASLSAVLEAGDYYLSVQGVGRGSPAADSAPPHYESGFSDYASLGQYFVSGVISRGPLTVRGGDDAELIVDGDLDPDLSDGTDFGLGALSSPTNLESVFAFENTDDESISIASITFDGINFTTDALTPLVISSGTSIDLTFVFNPIDIGIITEQVTVNYYKDSDPAVLYEYIFAISATATKTVGDDNYEQNDSYFETFPLPDETELKSILGRGRQADNDWYRITVLPDLNEINVTCEFDNDEGDINIALFDPRGYLITNSITTTDSVEEIVFEVDVAGGNYYIVVYGANEGNLYDLFWEGLSPLRYGAGGSDDAYERNQSNDSNDSFFGAYDLSSINGSRLSSIAGDAIQADLDWYKLVLDPSENLLNVSINTTNFVGGYNLALYDSRGYPLADSNGGQLLQEISYFGDLGATYYVVVSGDNQSGRYDLTYSGEFVGISTGGDDAYEFNNNIFQAYDLTADEGINLSDILGEGIQLDADWYQVRSNEGDNIIEIITNAAGDGLTYTLYSATGGQLTAPIDVVEGESTLIRVNLSAGNYVLLVTGGNVGATYDFSWQNRFAPEGDDVYEENDTIETAFDLTIREGQPLSRVSELAIQGDDDWYQILVLPGDLGIRVRASFAHAAGDINVAVHDDSGALVMSAESLDDDETLAVPIPTATEVTTYYIRVYGDNAENLYDLSWAGVISLVDDEYEPNNNFDDAFVLTPVEAGLLSDIAGLGVQADSDIYRLAVPADATTLQVFLNFSHAEGDIDIVVYDDDFDFRVFSVSVTDNEFVQLSVNPAIDSVFYLWVYFANAGNEYDMEWTYSFAPTFDSDLDNVGDAWENKHYGRMSAVRSGDSNLDGDKYPDWAEYALNTNPHNVDTDILKQYIDGGYNYVKYFRNTEASEAGYVYTVRESDNLSFSNPTVLPVHQVISHGDYEEVIYRATHAIEDSDQNFYYLEVDKP